MISKIKLWIKKHKKIHKIARFIIIHLIRHKKDIVYSFDDVGLLVDDWVKILPKDFNCIIGIPRFGLIVADMIAIHFGLPLSTPENFMRGEIWQSQRLNIEKMEKVLIIDDCVDIGRELNYAYKMLVSNFPKIKFEIGALVKNGKCDLDYFYVADSDFCPIGDYHKYDKNGVKPVHAHIKYLDLT